jgi:hypothetical protein
MSSRAASRSISGIRVTTIGDGLSMVCVGITALIAVVDIGAEQHRQETERAIYAMVGR